MGVWGRTASQSKRLDISTASSNVSKSNSRVGQSIPILPGIVTGDEGPYLALWLEDGSLVRFHDLLNQAVALWDEVFRTEPCVLMRPTRPVKGLTGLRASIQSF